MITKIIQSLVIIFFEAVCCRFFLNIFLRRKNHNSKCFMKSTIFFISVGFFLVSIFAPYFLVKSILIILVIVIVVRIYYSATILQNIVLSSIYYGILVGIDYLLITVLKLLLPEKYLVILYNSVSGTIIALLCKTLLLLIVVCIRKMWKSEDNLDMISNKEWLCLSCLPLITIISMTGMLYGFSQADKKITDIFLIIAFGLVALDFLVFYLIHDIVNREAAIQDSRLVQERTKNQMNIYRNMHETYEIQRKKYHDYKNQLTCIQGMLANGKIEETIEYITNLTGNLVKDMDIVHTNHAVVDAVINQKYRYAQIKGITFIMMVNDLSDLAVNEEDLVIVLSNILDNSIEACENLIDDKILKFKITAENKQLLISTQNPIIEPIQIVNNKVLTSKADKKEHGIGLLNIFTIVKKYNGTYAIQCKNGWFYLTILIPY